MDRVREIRRVLGAMAVGLGSLGLHEVDDHRSTKGRKHPLWRLLTAVLSGVAAGCRSLAELELLTAQMSPPVRRALRLWQRTPDTTLRDLLVEMPLDNLRKLLYKQVRAAHRRKQLDPRGLPCGVVAIDGKYTSTRLPDDTYAQRQKDRSWVVRTLSASLVSARAPVFIDAMPIPKERNEESAFEAALDDLLDAYKNLNLFEVLTADAGLASEANAAKINACGLGYVFTLKGNQPELLSEVDRQLARRPLAQAEAMSKTRMDKKTVVIRRLWRTTEVAGYHWPHLRMALRVRSEVQRDGQVIAHDDRLFATNVPTNRFTPAQWLRVIRAHWRVENECHGTLDRVFREDERPWLHQAHGLLVMNLLRRLTFNILDLFRRVSSRLKKKNEELITPWAAVCAWIRTGLVAADEGMLFGLRWAWATPPPTGQPPPISRVAAGE